MAKTKKRSSKVDKYAHLLGCVKDRYIIEKTGVTMPAVSRYRKKKEIKAFKDNIKTMAAALPNISSKAADKTVAKNLDLPEALVAVCRHLSELREDKVATIQKYDLLEPVVDAVLGEKIFAGDEENAEPQKTTKRRGSSRKRRPKKRTGKRKINFRKKSNFKSNSSEDEDSSSEDSSSEEANKKVILVKAYECFVTASGEESSFYTTAMNFQEAAQKFEAAHSNGAIKGDLVRILLMGSALA